MSFWMPGLVSGLALFVEEKRRRGELAMYVLPKALESIWVTARGKGLVFRTGKWGDVILAALGMAMVMVNEFTFSSKKKKKEPECRPLFSIKHRARTRMILNTFRDWLGGFYINSLGLISGSDIYTLVVVGEDRPPPSQTNVRSEQLWTQESIRTSANSAQASEMDPDIQQHAA